MPQPRRPSLETTCARPTEPPASTSQPLAAPLQLSSVYRFQGLDHIDAVYEGATGFVYARDGHPNAVELGDKIAALEGAESALVCASGMAAEAAVFLAYLDAGDHLALSQGLYGRTIALVTKELTRFSISASFFDATRAETLREALAPRTRLVFVETLSNPLVRLADIEGIATIASSAGAKLVVDHTFAPLLCRPLDLGAEAVTHSGTKLIGGHSDLTLGLLAGSRDLVSRCSNLVSSFGLNGNPFESWLALRGLATLGVRSTRACASALQLAERLAGHPKLKTVHYPGLTTHPDHSRALRILRGGFGTIASIDLGARSQADTFIRALRHIPFAPSLGDTSTTLSHPATTSHRGQTTEQWASQGITDGLVRLSIGLEDVDDLWNDLNQAFDYL
jgi:cystathionine beta-lyase/cystathionine gamma-synthase